MGGAEGRSVVGPDLMTTVLETPAGWAYAGFNPSRETSFFDRWLLNETGEAALRVQFPGDLEDRWFSRGKKDGPLKFKRSYQTELGLLVISIGEDGGEEEIAK